MQTNTPENSLATVTGGLTLKAKFQDGHEEEVRIKQVPVKEFDRYTLCLDSEPRMVEYLCGKPDGWSDNLTPESFEEIVIKGEEINSTDFFSRWIARRMERLGKLVPSVRQKLEELPSRNS